MFDSLPENVLDLVLFESLVDDDGNLYDLTLRDRIKSLLTANQQPELIKVQYRLDDLGLRLLFFRAWSKDLILIGVDDIFGEICIIPVFRNPPPDREDLGG